MLPWKLHGVAAQAVVHQERLLVVVFAQEDLRVGDAVRPRGPACVFFTMALGAALLDLEDVVPLEANLFGNFAPKMRGQLANVLEMKASVRVKTSPWHSEHAMLRCADSCQSR
jgi:hypothetical protein